jgi:hypothetical protein
MLEMERGRVGGCEHAKYFVGEGQEPVVGVGFLWKEGERYLGHLVLGTVRVF